MGARLIIKENTIDALMRLARKGLTSIDNVGGEILEGALEAMNDFEESIAWKHLWLWYCQVYLSRTSIRFTAYP